MHTSIFRKFFVVLFNLFILSGLAKDMQVESFTETVEDLTANTQPVLDLNNNKCALIKISIPEKANFEGNIVKAEYKTNEFYVYITPGTKQIALKYPGAETLLIRLSDFLDGSGVTSARTYRLEIKGIPQEYVWEPTHFIIKPQVGIGLGSAMNMSSSIPLSTTKSSANNFGIDFGYNVWQNEKNSLGVYVGIGYNPMSLTLETTNFSFNYFAPATADMDGNTYYRYYDVKNLKQEIKTSFLTVPIYLQYTYFIKHWLGIYADAGVSLAFKTSSNFESVSGDGNIYGIYPEYGNLLMDQSYLNGFGTVNFNDANRMPLDVNGFSASLLLGLGMEARIAGPLWVNVGVKYNAGLSNIYKSTYKSGEEFTSLNTPLNYVVSEGENANPLTNYLTGSKLSMFTLNVGLSLKF